MLWGEAMKRIAILSAISASLWACASGGGDYPSLAIRDGERMTGSAATPEAAAPAERVALSKDTVTRVAQLAELGRANHAEFSQIESRAERLVTAARGSAITTKANASAQIALAELQSAHEATLSVLAELDVLLANATLAGTQLTAIESARTDAAALAEQERAAIDRLAAILPSR
jgi:transcriptional antiterminator Rof (Rho-off)